MTRETYYEVPPAAYLFPRQSQLTTEREQPEEAVRQWCACELIRAYGFKISELNFERFTKIGSKNCRIDILVMQRDSPWIVVECKERKFTKHTEAIAQAISYADVPSVRAEFVLYTNGDVWNVQRRVQEKWVPVVDIPRAQTVRAADSLDEFLRSIDALGPLLHKLDEPIAGRDARLYLEAMQRFFCGANNLTAGIDQHLRFGTDNLLRVLATAPGEAHYSRSKISVAAKNFEVFRASVGIGYELPEIFEGEGVFAYIRELLASMISMVEGERGEGGVNVQIIRLNLALLDYAKEQYGPPGKYPPIPTHFYTALRGFLAPALAVNFNVHLPDPLEVKLSSDMKHFCSSAWDDLIQQDIKEQQQLRADFFSAIWGQLCFWRSK